MSHLQRAIEESVATLRNLSALEEPLDRAALLVLRALLGGHKLLVCGNGGSASDATHLATEFLCRFQGDRRPYPAISLTANGEFITAVCNDYHADEIFARQVWGLAEKGDVLIVITTSGKSKNILRALEEAKRKGLVDPWLDFWVNDSGTMNEEAHCYMLERHFKRVRREENQITTRMSMLEDSHSFHKTK